MPFVPVGPVTQTTALSPGDEVTVVNAATVTGTASSPQFCIAPKGGHGDSTLNLHALGVYTVATVSVEESTDGAVTWNTRNAAADFAANRVIQVLNVTAGPVYRLNVATLTGTSITINASAS